MLVIINPLTQTDAQRISEHAYVWGFVWHCILQNTSEKNGDAETDQQDPCVTIKLVNNEHCVHKNDGCSHKKKTP